MRKLGGVYQHTDLDSLTPKLTHGVRRCLWLNAHVARYAECGVDGSGFNSGSGSKSSSKSSRSIPFSSSVSSMMTEQIHPNEDAFGNHSCICSPPRRLRKQSSSCYNYHHASYGAFGTRLTLSRFLGCCTRFGNFPHLLVLESVVAIPEARPIFIHRADPPHWHPRSVRNWKGYDPFTFLDQKLREFSAQTLAVLPPFKGGCQGVLVTDRPPLSAFRHRVDEFAVPDLAVGSCDWVIAFDHWRDGAWLLSTGYPELEESARIQQARLGSIRFCIDSTNRSFTCPDGWVTPSPTRSCLHSSPSRTSDHYIQF